MTFVSSRKGCDIYNSEVFPDLVAVVNESKGFSFWSTDPIKDIDMWESKKWGSLSTKLSKKDQECQNH